MARKSQGRFIEPGKHKRAPAKRRGPNRGSRKGFSLFFNQGDGSEFEPPVRHHSRSILNHVVTHHAWVATNSLGQLLRAPLSTIMTVLVIAIALALPAVLFILLSNVKTLTHAWQDTAQLSVFLKKSTADAEAIKLQRHINSWNNVAEVEYLSAKKALDEFRQLSGFGDVLDHLDQNPLPPVLIIVPTISFDQTEQLQQLAERVMQQTQVDSVQLDLEWLRRLSALIELGQRGVLLLASLLGAAILLIIGNTIRLTIFNRRKEILVTKLIGGTNGFIRRPFLYTGLWYGLFGALCAWLLLGIFIGLIRGPAQKLAHLYQSQFSIQGLALENSLLLITIGITLGLVGSWLATSRHLQAIEPT